LTNHIFTYYLASRRHHLLELLTFATACRHSFSQTEG
jgi:hypothetical protein